MTTAISLAIQLADEIVQFPLGNCGPSDDPDKQYAYCAAFRDLATRFIGAIKRIGDPDLSPLVAELDSSSEGIITEAHELRARLYVAIDALREAMQDPTYEATAAANGAFISPEVLLILKSLSAARLDPAKLVRICEELNDAYARANYISAALLLRATINHVPTAFGGETFGEVVAQSSRSIKAILGRLNEDARPIADLHTHLLMRRNEYLPSKNQLEPYKAAFEVLIQEVIIKLTEA
jgi:hypothetical protein